MTLAPLLTSHRASLTALANAWLQAGAATFGVWDGDQQLAQWPSRSAVGAGLVSSIHLGALDVGELHLTGLGGVREQARLDADAALVSGLVQLENELTHMTEVLVERQDELLALYELTHSMGSQLSLLETLRALADESCRLASAQGAVAIFTPPDAAPAIVHSPQVMAEPALLLRFCQRACASGRQILVNADDGYDAFPVAIRTLLVTPLKIGRDFSGALVLLNKTSGSFTSPDVKLARAIAEQAGSRIENILLYEESLEQARLRAELNVAASIQLGLLPRHTPPVRGLDLHARTRPSLQVGGDFYTLVASADGPLAFAIGDVAGKGVPAALLMAMAQSTMTTAARAGRGADPARLLNRVNQDLYDYLTEVGLFATIFAGYYEPARRALLFANAGHSPVIYRPADGGARYLDADGPAIGVLPESLAETHEARFDVGDLLIACTDGFSEARNATDTMFGYDRLLHLADDISACTAQEITHALFAAVDTFAAGHRQDDDQTVVVIKAVSL